MKIARLTISPHQFNNLVSREKAAFARLGLDYICHHHRKGETPHPTVQDAHIIIPNTSYPIGKKELDAFKNLRGVLIPNSGYDHVDLEALQQRGIHWVHLPGPRAIDVCESTIMMMLDSARRSPWLYHNMEQGVWVRDQVEGTRRIRGRTIAIVGFGHIGRRLSTMLAPFEPAIIGVYDPYVAPQILESYPVRHFQHLQELVQLSDIITLHCSLTPSSRSLINHDLLQHFPANSCLINTARGPIVVEEDVRRSLDDGQLGTYATDVFAQEPLPPEHWMSKHPRVLCTPHVAGYSFEMLEQLIVDEVWAVKKWLDAWE
ncbi:NAD(P)-dependent oxidoreductase [Desulfurispira natronophila]|uniref:Phosphoglycerate dehydrogenase-like enzyme n=1 Tax=Desulfurispira natronophila TaxID=682562 RepID=A0A7W8DG67_9BACT|nr:D-isomer specific 2-hydroxyacid dehydrogenase family protein [Desulfurispira natronophila]MBB5021151.1 phosphoglycerate dehydrogenase-like enzyme [Desulfurispira natronophila]